MTHQATKPPKAAGRGALGRWVEKVDKNGPTPACDPSLGRCWIWTACINPATGYATFFDGKVTTGHRWSYAAFKGPIPDGLHIDHLCRVRACVNPDHLEAVTLAENNRRAAAARVRTHCRKGHELSPANIKTRKDRPSAIECRECSRAISRRWRERNRDV